MSDRLALAHAIEDAGIERSKAENVASVIIRVIEGSVATKVQLDAAKAELKADIAALDGKINRQDVAIERLRSTVREMESRLLVRLGSLMVVLTGVVLAALRYLPPH
jgi:hypothetical protein